jgi:hypothetical protein
VPLGPTIIRSKKDDVKFSPATVKWTVGAESIVIEVAHAAGTDRFTLDARPPRLLREWRQADGGRLTLQRSARIDYWNHHKLGDRLEGR